MVVIENTKEVEHLISVLKQAQRALEDADAMELNQLSDQTIHSASILQHTDFLTIAVLIYSLNKIVTRKERISEKKWNMFVRKFNTELGKAVNELKNRDPEEFGRHLEHARDLLENILGSELAVYVQDILKKAAVNKATKLYEHGISLSRTAQLLGLNQWEILEYVGQRSVHENPYTATIDEKKRAERALAFFS